MKDIRLLDKKKYFLDLSVHSLVDFLLRKGDIDTRVYNAQTMAVGNKIHAKYQEEQGNEYLTEVPLSATFNIDNFHVQIKGRADGIIIGEEIPIIDEIKSCNIDVNLFYEQQKDWHYGQAICYGYMYSLEHDETDILVRLTYISQEDPSYKLIKERKYTFFELKTEIIKLLNEYLEFYKKILDFKKVRNNSVDEVSFPFKKFRQGQRDMCKYVYGNNKNGGALFIEAPTGIGKTMSALFPSIKGFGRDIDKIFYFHAKGTGRESANNALLKLHNEGYVGHEVTLYSKDKICRCETRMCDPDHCPFAKDYFSKIKSVLDYALDEEYHYDKDYLIKLSNEFQICPFELQLDLSLFCDVVIGDYNYFFDPVVKLERFFGDGVNQKSYCLLIDEAHNLVERGRSMYSSMFSYEEICEMRTELRTYKKNASRIKKSLNNLKKYMNNEFLKIGEDRFAYEYDNLPSKLGILLDNVMNDNRVFCQKEKCTMSKRYEEICRELFRFKEIYTTYQNNLKLYITKEKDGKVYFHILNLDPSCYLKENINKVKSCTLFSATLSPIDFYNRAILDTDETPYLLLPSPFPKNNFSLTIAPSISTRYKDRNEQNYKDIASYLNTFVNSRTGNYFIFFTSYKYMESVKEFLNFDEAVAIEQEKNMTESDKEVFLEQFEKNPQKSKVGLVVLGGVFGEGIDLVGSRLSGVAVVGVGLPQLSFERNMIKEYFDEKLEGKGFEYAYQATSINHIMQSVGRLIRSDDDKGVCLLIDERYTYWNYRKIFSRVWKEYNIASNTKDLEKILEDFYMKTGI